MNRKNGAKNKFSTESIRIEDKPIMEIMKCTITVIAVADKCSNVSCNASIHKCS